MQMDKALGNEEVGIGEPSAGPLASVIYKGLVRKSLDENLYTAYEWLGEIKHATVTKGISG